MTKKIIEEIQQLLIRKRVNVLIGSGASVPGVKMMSAFPSSPEQKMKGVDYDINALNLHVRNISRYIRHPEKFRTVEPSEDIVEFSKCSDMPTRYCIFEETKRNIETVSKQYENFISNLVEILNKSNSRSSEKNINIFTTNYDLFIERAVENCIHKKPNLIFNDGANGYFDRKLDSFNYDRSVSYKSQFDSTNIYDEMPSISLLKPHGSVNWELGKGDEEADIFIRNSIVGNPVIVAPDGNENEKTYAQNHYYEMLRLFQVELSKPESVLLVFGFSFGDAHIAKMVQRALSNPQIMVYVFSYSNQSKERINNNLKAKEGTKNLKVLGPTDILEKHSSVDRLDLERLNNYLFSVGA